MGIMRYLSKRTIGFVLWLGWDRSKEVGAHTGLGNVRKWESSMIECLNKFYLQGRLMLQV